MEKTEYGKFNSAEELLKGYRELESKFTQKCQQLSLAEKQLQENALHKTAPLEESDEPLQQAETCAETTLANGGTSTEVSPSTEAAQSTTVDSAETVPQAKAATQTFASDGPAPAPNPTEQQLQQYLKDHPEEVLHLLQKNSDNFVGVMSGGGNVSLALPSRPRSIKEASLMAKELFKN